MTQKTCSKTASQFSLQVIHTHQYFNPLNSQGNYNSCGVHVQVAWSEKQCLTQQLVCSILVMSLSQLQYLWNSIWFVFTPHFIQPINNQINRGHGCHYHFHLKAWSDISLTFYQNQLNISSSFQLTKSFSFKSFYHFMRLLHPTSNLLGPATWIKSKAYSVKIWKTSNINWSEEK